MTNPLLTAEEQAQIDALRGVGFPMLKQRWIDRVDWTKWFIRAALILNSIALLYLATLYCIQVTYIGFIANISSLGLLLMGWYFFRCILTASDDDGINVLLLSAAMYALTTIY